MCLELVLIVVALLSIETKLSVNYTSSSVATKNQTKAQTADTGRTNLRPH